MAIELAGAGIQHVDAVDYAATFGLQADKLRVGIFQIETPSPSDGGCNSMPPML
jgi:hypothetical protein